MANSALQLNWDNVLDGIRTVFNALDDSSTLNLKFGDLLDRFTSSNLADGLDWGEIVDALGDANGFDGINLDDLFDASGGFQWNNFSLDRWLDAADRLFDRADLGDLF